MIEKIYQVNFTWHHKGNTIDKKTEQMNLPVFFNQYTFVLTFKNELRKRQGFPDCTYTRNIDFNQLDSLVTDAITAIEEMCIDAVYIVYEIPRDEIVIINSQHKATINKLNMNGIERC